MNKMTTHEDRRDEMLHTPLGFVEPSREELEQTQGGAILSTSYTLSLITLNSQPAPPGITLLRF